MIREQWSNPWFIGWSSRRDPSIHTHTHTHLQKHMHVCKHTRLAFTSFSAESASLRQEHSEKTHKHTHTHAHTRMLANQTEINPDRLRINSGYFAQCFIGIIPPLRSPLLKYPQCICMMNERPDDRLKINLSSIRQKRVYPVTQMST